MATEVTNPSAKPEHKRTDRTIFIRKHRLPLGVFSALIIIAAIVLSTVVHHTASSATASTSSHASMQLSAAAANGPSSSFSSASGATSIASSGATSSQQSAAPSSKAASSSPTSSRDIIKTANLHLSVRNVSQAADTLTQLTTSAGGFVASMRETSNASGIPTAQNQTTSLTLRVPENDFQHLITGAKGLGHVQSFTQSGQDVTDEHNTLTAKLAELNSESKAYTRLYNKAQSMKDMLQIQQSLSQVQSQIDQMETKLHQLNQSISFATINVTLSPALSSLPQANMTTSGAFSSSLHFMKVSGHALVVFLAFVLPWAALLAVILGIVKLALQRKRK